MTRVSRFAELRDPAILANLYHGEGLPLSAIADRLGCSVRNVHRAMIAHGIERRPSGVVPAPPIIERIWPRLEVGDCWVWTGARQVGGYGVIGWREGDRNITRRVHRIVWEHLVGPIPDGLHLDHLCRNPPCCNPDHLEPVTPKENTLRALRHRGQPRLAEVCGNGHPWSENEWRPSPNAKHQNRRCRACMAAHNERVKERKR